MIFLMDWDTFCVGLKIYFNRHKWSNTSLEDFIGCMQEGYNEKKPDTPLDLTQWSQEWLQTKGVNKIAAEVEEADGKYTKFTLKQTPCKHADNQFRRQTINISLFNNDGGLIEKIERVVIENKELTEIEVLKGKNVPKAVLLNSDDWGYGYFVPDDASL